MHENPQGFIHSNRVPKIYKVASKILQLVQEKGAGLKELVFNSKCKHPNTKGLYALVVETIQHGTVLDRLIRESQILIKVERLDAWLARILITELLWGKKKLPPNCKPTNTILEYQPTFLSILREAVKSGTHDNEPRRNKADLKPRYIRVNTLLLSVGDAITAFRYEGWHRATVPSNDYAAFIQKLATLGEDEFLQDFHVKQLFAFPPRTEFFNHELYLNGSLILQDKATCLAAFLLDPTPGSAVLDMCAAPGLKTTQLAAILGNNGTIYAVEKDPRRYKTLCEFVANHGAKCVTTINADATMVTPEECQKVEYVLVDPSCSGSGMTRPTSIDNNEIDDHRLKKLAAFQEILLEKALTKFPTVKRVVYSTCSIYPQENEEVVEKVLRTVNSNSQFPRFKLADNLLESWPNRGSNKYELGPKCLFADPDKDLTTGFFIAMFEKIESSEGEKSEVRKRNKDKKRTEGQATGNQKIAEVDTERNERNNRQMDDGAENEIADRGDSIKKKKKKHKRAQTEIVEKNDIDGMDKHTEETKLSKKWKINSGKEDSRSRKDKKHRESQATSNQEVLEDVQQNKVNYVGVVDGADNVIADRGESSKKKKRKRAKAEIERGNETDDMDNHTAENKESKRQKIHSRKENGKSKKDKKHRESQATNNQEVLDNVQQNEGNNEGNNGGADNAIPRRGETSKKKKHKRVKAEREGGSDTDDVDNHTEENKGHKKRKKGNIGQEY